ncbi:pyruvate, phosphate dikinase [Neoactinobaculum massilliense]|uniref:pyruvate, phosphate dikinase n=1 Tax=Neoactinobaculum massilliense TaxID=2364794 RepID=UPI000F54855B|nr:pyruvate, phosphate dikinase [Neoactinobaculum massilliense]
MTKFVYAFAEGNKDMRDLLGGKGANLAEMTNMNMPVPPGFTVTTDVCRQYLGNGSLPDELADQVSANLAEVEKAMGRKFGATQSPLLVSVRSGAPFSMPGMMETVLNVGLNDETVKGLAAMAGSDRFAWDSYRRLLQMFGKTVLDIDGDLFANPLHELQAAKGYKGDLDMTAEDLRGLADQFKQVILEQTGKPFPQDPREQLNMAIEAVFRSWNTERAQVYRRREHISETLGTAVNVQTMVFGNMGENSGTGVAFTRDPSTGRSGVYGDYLPDAQGEDVVSGIRNTLTLDDLAGINKPAYTELVDIMHRLEEHYRDLCDIEYTVENGKLWMLQTRVGKRTPAAAFRVATQLADEGLITEDEAVTRVTGEQLTSLLFPQFDQASHPEPITVATPASPGAASGEIVFSDAEAVRRAGEGAKVILVRRETNAEDLPGMVAAVGVLTARGGKTSHAAVVARGMGRTAVVGADELIVDEAAQTLKVCGGKEFHAGDIISIDGTSGEVFAGAVDVVDSPAMVYVESGLEAGLAAARSDDDKALVRSLDRILTRADKAARMKVRANADNPEDAQRAREFGATGVGLCRTEHMFLGERRPLVEHVILARTPEEQAEALSKLGPLQKSDFEGIFKAMDGLPVVVRLIDPPLHEFLPDLTQLTVEIAVKEAKGEEVTEHERAVFEAAKSRHEENPMLGLRGVRLSIEIPGFVDMQVRAVAEAAVARIQAGGDPHPEIMIPLIGSGREMEIVKTHAERVIADVEKESGIKLEIPVGNMIELPRAALVADEIAEQSQFFSFGTNDLTQTTWGFSRDDVEGEFIPTYIADGVFDTSPFESIDEHGVGQLVETAVARGRKANPDLLCGICGEHGGDPRSIHFFNRVGLDYVSCSPFRVPIARLEAGRATLMESLEASETK